MGDRLKTLEQAWHKVSAFLTEMDHSSLWETDPQIVEDQPRFYNMVFSGMFRGTPVELLRKLQAVEASLGRDRSREVLKGPRTLDLDILYFGDIQVNQSDLIIPHASLLDRAFVLVPLLELYPRKSPVYDKLEEALNEHKNQKVDLVRKKVAGSVFFNDTGLG